MHLHTLRIQSAYCCTIFDQHIFMGSALVRHESCHFGKQIQMLISDCYRRIGRKTVVAGVLIFLLITLS